MIGSRAVALRAGRHLTRVLWGTGTPIGGTSLASVTRPKSNGSGESHRGKSGKTDSAVCTMASTKENSSDGIPDAKLYPVLDKLGFLGQSHIRIKDLARVEELVGSMVEGGKSKLQLVVDFDYTLTRVHFDGKRCQCSWGVMDNSPNMPAFYREEANQLLSTYYPIEIHPTMSEAEKIPHMVEWYGRIHDLLVKCHFTQSSIEGMVAESNTRLREGSEELFGSLNKYEVPVLVLSAGMGDILEQVLRHYNIYNDNVKVVSNFFKYNDEGVMIGFKGNTIHMFNKNEDAIHSSDYFHRLEGRNNVILLGDSLGDVKMAIGVPQPSSVLKIAFLNDKIDERLESYMNAFDIVLIDDQTMNVAKSLVDLIK